MELFYLYVMITVTSIYLSFRTSESKSEDREMGIIFSFLPVLNTLGLMILFVIILKNTLNSEGKDIFKHHIRGGQ